MEREQERELELEQEQEQELEQEQEREQEQEQEQELEREREQELEREQIIMCYMIGLCHFCKQCRMRDASIGELCQHCDFYLRMAGVRK